MKTRMQTDSWITHASIVLGAIVVTTLVGIFIIMLVKHSFSEFLVAPGFIAGAGLAMLWISPLKRELDKW